LEVWILEVGLGGRLDAVNLVDADLALVSSIGLDHVEWLGNTRELIAQEKAGIFRPRKPVVCGDFDPPSTLIKQAQQLAAPFYCQGRDFHFSLRAEGWDFQGQHAAYFNLPYSQLACQNLATALMAVELLQAPLPVPQAAIQRGIETVFLPGRIEMERGSFLRIFDVAHNPSAVAFLAERLQKLTCQGKKRAVFSMLADKDMRGSLRVIKNQIDEWYVAPLQVRRGASAEQLDKAFREEEISAVHFYDSVQGAQKAAQDASGENDVLLFFGSFYLLEATRARS
jgi:dihydrofolate synthase/folylpolyglutamate synthase